MTRSRHARSRWYRLINNPLAPLIPVVLGTVFTTLVGLWYGLGAGTAFAVGLSLNLAFALAH